MNVCLSLDDLNAFEKASHSGIVKIPSPILIAIDEANLAKFRYRTNISRLGMMLRYLSKNIDKIHRTKINMILSVIPELIENVNTLLSGTNVIDEVVSELQKVHELLSICLDKTSDELATLFFLSHSNQITSVGIFVDSKVIPFIDKSSY